MPRDLQIVLFINVHKCCQSAVFYFKPEINLRRKTWLTRTSVHTSNPLSQKFKRSLVTLCVLDDMAKLSYVYFSVP